MLLQFTTLEILIRLHIKWSRYWSSKLTKAEEPTTLCTKLVGIYTLYKVQIK